MNQRFHKLQLQQMDTVLSQWRAARLPARPSSGWSRAIREALGMTATALAGKLRMTSAGVHKLESSESNDAITLASLRKLASALDCELQYALVPRTTLAQQLQNRALQVASARLRPVAHSMALEDQSVEGSASYVQRELMVQELLDGSRRELW